MSTRQILFIYIQNRYNLFSYPPIGILYLSSIAKQKGYSTSLFGLYDPEFGLDNIDTFFKCLNEYNPDICAFSFYTPSALMVFNTILQIKVKKPKCHIIVGGPHASALPVQTMKDCQGIDFLVYGEGEDTFSEFLDALENKKKFSHIKGLTFRHENEILCNEKRELIENLDTTPFPDYELVKDQHYSDIYQLGNRTMSIISSRGCPFNCNFCFKLTFGLQYRRRTPSNVVREIKFLRDNYQIDDITFCDEIFGMDKQWMENFYTELKNNKVKTKWKCMTRVDTLKKKDFIKMKKYGCYAVALGIESGNNDVLQDINKRINRKQVQETCRDARNTGLTTIGFFILGHRRDDYQSIKQTLNFTKELNLDFVLFSLLTPYPGTQVYSYVPDEVKYDWHKFNPLHPINICPQVTSENLQSFLFQGNEVLLYKRFKYLWANVIFSKDHFKMRKRKFLYWLKAMRNSVVFQNS